MSIEFLYSRELRACSVIKLFFIIANFAYSVVDGKARQLRMTILISLNNSANQLGQKR